MTKDYKNPAATATLIIEKSNRFDKTFIDFQPNIYLIRRKHEPFKGMLALPGGYLNCDKESLEEAAIRETKEETPFIVDIKDLELLCVNSSPKRDPRGHVIDHVYIVKEYAECPHADNDYDDAEEGKFFPLNEIPPLAFDHSEVIKKYKEWRKERWKITEI